MKKRYKMFGHVRLKDGREGAIVEVFGDQDVFLIDIGTDPQTWDTITVYPEEIEEGEEE